MTKRELPAFLESRLSKFPDDYDGFGPSRAASSDAITIHMSPRLVARTGYVDADGVPHTNLIHALEPA